MPPKPLDTTINAENDEKTAATYDRQPVRSQAIAHRHTRLAVESAGRGDDKRSRFEMEQGRPAWEAAHLDRQRDRSMRSRAVSSVLACTPIVLAGEPPGCRTSCAARPRRSP